MWITFMEFTNVVGNVHLHPPPVSPAATAQLRVQSKSRREIKKGRAKRQENANPETINRGIT